MAQELETIAPEEDEVSMLGGLKLSPGQVEACDKIYDWFKNGDSKTFVLAGYAGTGKTTMAKEIARLIGNVHFCAFTGKAANVLREKGCRGASTIHGSIYKLERIKETGKMIFTLNTESIIEKKKLIIVDEYSMLPKEIIEDLALFNVKILYLGDNFQLPPVFGVCPLVPDHFLTEVHRQALDNPILRAATMVREDGRLGGFVKGDRFSFLPEHEVGPEEYVDADQVIVGYNATRTKYNARFRKIYGRTSKYPQAGDKMICLKNNTEQGLFNGMMGVCSGDAEFTMTPGTVMFNMEVDGLDRVIKRCWDGDFLGKDTRSAPREFDRFDYAYAITCHKSQGSEFNNTLVRMEPVGKTEVDKQKWVYTALTRAKEKLTLVRP